VIKSAEQGDLDHVVYFEFKLYNGLAADNENLFFMYA